ncbi:hypothetical protein ACKXGF_05070 [Alkalibacillus sp. S2W]|uniref:hypothetical protein n=1 Tax=Alkalibacillus sp. S2W TaxID=3386553 RepID=UPI00398CDD2C
MSIEPIQYNSWKESKFDPRFENFLLGENKIKLSNQPTVPGKDEDILHDYIDHKFYMTNTGLTLLLQVKNEENDEIYTYIYPDIEKIEAHSENSFKFYIDCINRDKKRLYEENKLSQRYGEKAEDLDYTDKYRIQLVYKH